jgi:hypothetical protein
MSHLDEPQAIASSSFVFFNVTRLEDLGIDSSYATSTEIGYPAITPDQEGLFFFAYSPSASKIIFKSSSGFPVKVRTEYMEKLLDELNAKLFWDIEIFCLQYYDSTVELWVYDKVFGKAVVANGDNDARDVRVIPFATYELRKGLEKSRRLMKKLSKFIENQNKKVFLDHYELMLCYSVRNIPSFEQQLKQLLERAKIVQEQLECLLQAHMTFYRTAYFWKFYRLTEIEEIREFKDGHSLSKKLEEEFSLKKLAGITRSQWSYPLTCEQELNWSKRRLKTR